MRYTKTNLQKLEDLFKELSYSVRYEKGNFRSGYCLVEQKKIIVISKFYEIEERINGLLDILSKIEINREILSEAGQKTLLAAFKPNEDKEDKPDLQPELPFIVPDENIA